MIDGWQIPTLAMVTAMGAVFMWTIVLGRVIEAVVRRKEHRSTYVAFAVMGLVTAIGTLASALAAAIAHGEIVLTIDRDTLSLVASMGRGALLMAGALMLAYYHPPYGQSRRS